MQTQAQWIDLYKREKNIESDYKLGLHWGFGTAEMAQLRRGSRKLPLAKKIMIAQALSLDPLQVFISCEYYKAREDEQEFLKTEYFKSVMKTYNVAVPVGFYKKRRFKNF